MSLNSVLTAVLPSAPIQERVRFRIRTIRSEADISSLAMFGRLRAKHFHQNDILGLPSTVAQASAWLARQDRKVFGSFMEDGRCVGACVWNSVSHMGQLSYAVDPDFEGRGLARALIRYAVTHARKARPDSDQVLDLLVDKANTASVRAAAACGFSMSAQANRTMRMRFGQNPAVREFVFMEYSARGRADHGVAHVAAKSSVLA